MIHGRLWHDACFVGPFIYVVGGTDLKHGPVDVKSTEQYCMRQDKWLELPKSCDVREYPRELTIFAAKKRFIFCFGGKNGNDSNEHGKERIGRLDTLKLPLGWTDLIIRPVFKPYQQGTQYGRFSLLESDDSVQILVWGGMSSPEGGNELNRLFTTDPTNFQNSTFEVLSPDKLGDSRAKKGEFTLTKQSFPLSFAFSKKH